MSEETVYDINEIPKLTPDGLEHAITMSRLIDEATLDTRVQLLVSIRFVDDESDKMTVDLIHARIHEKTETSIKLGVTRNTKKGTETFYCWFYRAGIYVERFDRHDNRLDLQIKRNYQLEEYQEKWVSKNLEWSTYE